MDNLLTEITPALLQFVSTLFVALLGWATVKVKEYFDKKGITEKISQYDYLAELAVKAVEQVYKNENGDKKKNLAKDYLIDSLDKLGLDVTPQQLDMFIESAVKRMNDDWKQEDKEVTVEVKPEGK